jgi:hypothetical protein
MIISLASCVLLRSAGRGPIYQPLDDYYRILLINNEMNYHQGHHKLLSWMSRLSNRDECLEQHKGQRQWGPREGNAKGLGHNARGFLIFEEVLHYGLEEPKKNAPGAMAQGMSELDSLRTRVHRNSVDA